MIGRWFTHAEHYRLTSARKQRRKEWSLQWSDMGKASIIERGIGEVRRRHNRPGIVASVVRRINRRIGQEGWAKAIETLLRESLEQGRLDLIARVIVAAMDLEAVARWPRKGNGRVTVRRLRND